MNSILRVSLRLMAWLVLSGCAVAHAQALPTLAMEQAVLRLKAKGYVLMMRHAQTEAGVGDPENFKLGDCSTQRNLSPQGRTQARRIGKAFADAGLRFDKLLSSQWCRCLETARIAFGEPEPWPVLNSTFNARGQQAEQGRLIEQFAREQSPGHNVMLVTHQLTITPLTGGWVESGEIIAFRLVEGRLLAQFRLAPPVN